MRTKFFISVTSLLVIVLCLIGCTKTEKEPPVVFCSWGGSYQEAQREAYLKPFEKQFGVRVDEATYSGEYAKLKAMVDTGNIQWDVVSVTLSIFERGSREGLFEPIDYTIVNTTNLLPNTYLKYGVAHLYFSTVQAYNTEFYKNNPRPRSWSEFWDVNQFPGKRALRDTPKGNLEFALLADGVEPKNLYPLDVDRAFGKLTEIKPFIKVWWKQGQQPPQLLSTGEIQLSTAFNGRIWTAAQLGESVAIEWGGGMLESEYFVILKGSKNIKNAQKLINFAVTARYQEAFVKQSGYGPTNRLVFDKLSKEFKENLPSFSTNLDSQFVINGEYWADNETKLLNRWNEWRISK